LTAIDCLQRKQRSPASVGRSQSEQPPIAPPLTLDYYADSLKSMSLEPGASSSSSCTSPPSS